MVSAGKDWSTDEMRAAADNWTLANDVSLREHLVVNLNYFNHWSFNDSVNLLTYCQMPILSLLSCLIPKRLFNQPKINLNLLLPDPGFIWSAIGGELSPSTGVTWPARPENRIFVDTSWYSNVFGLI